MSDAKARLVEVIGAALNDGWRHEAGRLADKVLAEFNLTPKAPPGPVTSEEAIGAYERAFQRVNAGAWFDPDLRVGRRVALDAAMPRLARDHGYIKLAEVERRAREWVDGWRMSPAFEGELIRALTAPTGKEGV